MKLLSVLTKNNITNTRSLSYGRMRTWYANLVKPKKIDPPYHHVVQVGDPTLRLVADPVPVELVKSDQIQNILKRLFTVLNKYKCVGMSAPQIGIPYRIFIMEFNEKHRKSYSSEEARNKEMSLVPFTVVINPEMKVTDFTKLAHPESCESIKGYWADVPRYRAVELKGLDEDANPLHIEANGWVARIIQHEMDHLNGKLYTDIMDRKSLTCSCWEVVNERSGRVRIPLGPD